MQVLRNCVTSAFRIGNLIAGNATNSVCNALGQQRNLCSMVFRNVASGSSSSPSLLEAPSLLTTIVRTKTRNHFPVPREVKRIRGHGLKKRLKTPGGRKIIINRIIKGRHELAHGW